MPDGDRGDLLAEQPPGEVDLVAQRTLFVATLGNFLLNGKAGLLFVDFANGDVLQMTGDAEVVLDSPEIAAFQGAERLWRFRARSVVRQPGALALRWSFRKNGWSPTTKRSWGPSLALRTSLVKLGVDAVVLSDHRIIGPSSLWPMCS